MKSPITSTEHVLATASSGVSLTFSRAGSRGGSTGGLDGFAVFFAMHQNPVTHTPGCCYHYSVHDPAFMEMPAISNLLTAPGRSIPDGRRDGGRAASGRAVATPQWQDR